MRRTTRTDSTASDSIARGAGRRAGRVAALPLALAVLAGLTLAPGAPVAQATVCEPPVGSSVCTEPGTNPKPPPPPPSAKWKVKYQVWENHIRIYKEGKLKRDIKVAGNPYLSPRLPSTCTLAQKIRVNWDKTLVWRLDYFTRLCAGRGVGTHAIPINRYDGRMSMNPADLGKTPGAGSPLSHGCARMLAKDARWIYERVPLGTTVKISYKR